MADRLEKANKFRALHESGKTFTIPNPWDVGSAKLLEKAGFAALATTSAGFANAMGKADGQVSLEEKLGHCRSLVLAVDLPISADLENGFADTPEDAAANLVAAAETGLAGASIEDFSGSEVYDFNYAVERVAACAEAVSRLSIPFIFTARAEGLLRKTGDIDDVIERLQAFEAAGADVLFAPGLNSLEQVQQVISAVTKPVNVLAPFMPTVSLAQYQEAGVCRVSIGGALAHHATKATLSAAHQMIDSGSFSWK